LSHAQLLPNQKMELPKSGSVILTSSVVENVYQYELLLKTPAGLEINPSSVKIKALKGRESAPQHEWRYLISCDENPEMIVVLLATSRWTMILLQYDLNTKTVREEHLAAVQLMDDRRDVGGTLSVKAPNRITLSNPNGTSQSWSVVDGQFFDDNGNVFVQNEGSWKGLRTGESTSQTTKGAAVPDNVPNVQSSSSPKMTEPKPPTANEEPTSSMPVTIIGVLILVATGLLWLLLKKRKIANSSS
jgi:hypothetical protein